MEVKKICIECKMDKSISEYYKNKMMRDGYVNKCKDCAKKYSRQREKILKEDSKWVEKELFRSREKYHRLYSTTDKSKIDENYNRIWMTQDEIPKRKRDVKSEWRRNNPEKEKMRNKLYNNRYPEKYKAHRNSQRLPCEKGNQLHHWSYNEEHWKDCIELNVADHSLLHRYIKYDQERYMYRNLDGILLDTKQSHIDLLESLKSKGVA